jgi:phosphoglycerol transferase MdoB-like AlkP superfamily enzyme
MLGQKGGYYTDLLFLFVLALSLAIATVVIRKLFGKRVAAVVKLLLTAAVILPLVLIIFFGITRSLQASQENAREIGLATARAVVDYAVVNLPGIVISDIAGIMVGHTVAPLIKRL